MLLIGVDEAGYGPNLGPLTIGVAAWSVPSGDTDLYSQLGAVVCHKSDGNRLVIADSKQLYSPGGSLELLETAVLAAWRVAQSRNRSTAPTICRLAGLRSLEELPWYKGYDPPLPADANSKAVEEASQLLLSAGDIRPLAVGVRIVEPAEFNAGVDQLGSKGALLSALSVDLARQVASELLLKESAVATDKICLQFDKHGGRNRYVGILQHAFAADWIDTVAEARASSSYHWQKDGRKYQASFTARGETQLATALASMAAKYVRELCMKAFNAFWCQRIEGLRPTAGYPVDAKRFRQAIARQQAELEIADVDLWRNR